MAGIIGIIALLTILGLSLIITRVATVALTLTGLSPEAARFQARSAFTGTGFTTSEAEAVVDHPARRRIIMTLMLLRSAGVVTILLSLILSFMGTEDASRLQRLYWLVGGVIVLWLLSMSNTVDRLLKAVMTWFLRRSTDLDVRDYVSLLHLSGEYLIREMAVEEQDWIAGKTLSECRLHDEGITTIGIHRENGHYVGVPTGDTTIHPGDTLILYGRSKALQNLDHRRKGGEGDEEHGRAVGDQQRHMEEQEREERAYETTHEE